MKDGAEVLAYGLHAVRHALNQRDDERALERVLLLQNGRTDSRLQEVARLAAAQGIAARTLGRAELDKIAGGRHQGVVLMGPSARRGQTGEQDLEAFVAGLGEGALLLVLDGVQDPHNLGACLRSADAAGAQAVIVPRRRAAGLGATVRKVAAGAAEHVPLYAVPNLARALRFLAEQGVSIIGTDGASETGLFSADLTGPVALVLGSEEKGLRRLTREHCDQLVSLPMAGAVESLNVSVAAGICLFEAVRQRRA